MLLQLTAILTSCFSAQSVWRACMPTIVRRVTSPTDAAVCILLQRTAPFPANRWWWWWWRRRLALLVHCIIYPFRRQCTDGSYARETCCEARGDQIIMERERERERERESATRQQHTDQASVRQAAARVLRLAVPACCVSGHAMRSVTAAFEGERLIPNAEWLSELSLFVADRSVQFHINSEKSVSQMPC